MVVSTSSRNRRRARRFTSSPLTAARPNVCPAWLEWLIFPPHVNYRIEHHLYASVPHYSLPRLHREMAARGVLDGAEVVPFDATPMPETQAAYDRMETLRDPSHASALTLSQLRTLAADVGGLEEVAHDFHWLDARLESLADADRMAALVAMFEADIAEGRGRMGVQPSLTPDGVRFRFPISIVAWRRL